MALGADWCNAARGFMFALGCMQAQTCHTGACPTGVATQDPRRQQALVVPDKIERVYRFHQNTLEALKELVQAAGLNASEPDQRLPHRAPRRRPRGAAAGQPAALRAAGRAAGRGARRGATGRTTSTATTGRWPARTASRRCSRWRCRRRRTSESAWGLLSEPDQAGGSVSMKLWRAPACRTGVPGWHAARARRWPGSGSPGSRARSRRRCRPA